MRSAKRRAAAPPEGEKKPPLCGSFLARKVAGVYRKPSWVVALKHARNARRAESRQRADATRYVHRTTLNG